MSHSSNYLQSSLKFPEKSIQNPDTENDVTFFKELIQDFHNRMINAGSFDNFENLSIK